MADTTPVETVPVAPSNESSTTPAPITDTKSIADVEAAKDAEKLAIRNRQLENDLAKMKADQDAVRQKQLEEKEEFKKLYEETNTKLSDLEANQQAETKRQALTKATEDLFKEYDPAVVDLAKTTNLTLGDDTEEAKADLKGKLDAIKSKVAPQSRVTPNNPAYPAPDVTNRSQQTAKAADGSSPMALAGAKGDDSVVYQYIHDLPAIQRMREMASQGN